MSAFSSLQEIRVAGQTEFEGKPFPYCVTTNQFHSNDSFVEWLNTPSAREEIDQLLRQYKAIYFKNTILKNVQDFHDVINATGLLEMAYVGGAAVRTQITSRVFTSNESPASEKIPFHHEMSQVPEPPTHLFFYCEIPSEIGGETPLLPSAQICKRMSDRFPEFMQQVEEQGVRYVRIMPCEDDPSSAIGRGWKSTFLTDSKDEAEKKLLALGSSWEWLENGDLKTITSVLPAIRIDSGEQRSNDKTFYNSMVAAYMGWNDTRNEGKYAVQLGNGEYCNEEAMIAASEIMDEISANIRWESNDFMLIDNRTVMHARKPYEGKRRILASLARDVAR